MEGNALQAAHSGHAWRKRNYSQLCPGCMGATSNRPNPNAPPESKVGGDLARPEDERDGTDEKDAQ